MDQQRTWGPTKERHSGRIENGFRSPVGGTRRPPERDTASHSDCHRRRRYSGSKREKENHLLPQSDPLSWLGRRHSRPLSPDSGAQEKSSWHKINQSGQKSVTHCVRRFPLVPLGAAGMKSSRPDPMLRPYQLETAPCPLEIASTGGLPVTQESASS